MGKIRGRDYISWLWQYTAPYAGRIGLLLLFGLLETFASLAMVQITKEIIDHATVGSGFGRLLTGYVLLLLGMQGISVLSTLLTALVTERFSFGIRRQIYEKILYSDWRDVQPCAAAQSAGRPLQVQRIASPTSFRPMQFRTLRRLLPRSVALQLFT